MSDEPLHYKTRIKQILQQGYDINIHSSFWEELDGKILEVSETAIERAQENNRNTVMGRDL